VSLHPLFTLIILPLGGGIVPLIFPYNSSVLFQDAQVRLRFLVTMHPTIRSAPGKKEIDNDSPDQ